MANANTNLLSVGSSKTAAATTKSSTRYKTAAPVDRKDNFNSHLDKANAKANQDQQIDKVVEEAKNAQTPIQGQKNKPQDAPQEEKLETPPENVSEEVKEVSDVDEGQENPAIFSYLFSGSTETLLTVKDSEVEQEGNLMTILPTQTSDAKSQTMLDLLGGKTWTSADVTSEFQNLNQQPQNPIQPQVEDIQLPTNLNQQSQNPIQPQVQNQQSQPTTQNLADMLGVNVQLEDGQQIAPTAPTQQFAQQFEQNNSQSNSQNFAQNLNQSTAPEIQQTTSQAAEGGETFVANFAQANNTPQPVQQDVQVQSPEVAQNVRDDFNVRGQIVEQARLIRNAQSTEMVINLKPEHLGELTLRISVSHSGTLNANFYSDNAQVRAVIENSLVQLKQELSNAGLKVEDVQVYSGLSDGGLTGQGQSAWQQNQQQKNSNRRIDFSAFEEDADLAQPVAETETSDGVDYKV